MQSFQLEDMEYLMQEIRAMDQAGIPMPTGLAHLAEECTRISMKPFLKQLAAEVEQGVPLSEALARQKGQLPGEIIPLIQCGEKSGSLAAVSQLLVDHIRERMRNRESLRQALVYPGMVICGAVLILVFIANFVIHNFVDIFNQLGAELPYTTQFILGFLSMFMGPFAVIPLAVAIYLIGLLVFRNRWGNRFLEFIGRLPGYSKMTDTGDHLMLGRFLALLLPKGIPLPVVLNAAALAMTSSENQQAVELMAKAAEEGRNVTPYLPPHLPANAAWILQRGEAQGTLNDACCVMVDLCRERFERAQKSLSLVAEPLAMALIGICIGVLVIAMYLPLFSIPKLIGR